MVNQVSGEILALEGDTLVQFSTLQTVTLVGGFIRITLFQCIPPAQKQICLGSYMIEAQGALGLADTIQTQVAAQPAAPKKGAS